MLQEKAIALLSAPNYATLTTLFGDGHPQTNLVWVGHDGENVLVNTERHRQKSSTSSGICVSRCWYGTETTCGVAGRYAAR